MENDRADRARARKQRMVIARQGGPDGTEIQGLEAFALAARLSRDQWLLAGNELPSYSRAEMPISFTPGKG